MPTIYLLDKPLSATQTLHFAASELQHCLQRMTGETTTPIVEHQQYQPSEPGLWLGTFASFLPQDRVEGENIDNLGVMGNFAAHNTQIISLSPPSLAVSEREGGAGGDERGNKSTPESNGVGSDDEIHIAVDGGNGLIAGSNPRSLLMAVYHYLGALGCRWVRPGADGEFIPKADPSIQNIHIHETPAYRHRAVCIEGAVSLENVLDMVDWLPKLGLSGYFMQFREGFTFFDRWYRHANNPLKAPEAFSVDQARQFTRQIETELQKRGLSYQAIGHGWTCEAFGIPCLGWDREPDRLWPPEFLRCVAEVNGKRSVPWDIASIAALCYSDPVVQEKLASCVVDYAASHPQIDLLHVWLDDGFNNKCECPRCRTHLPADDYIQILNAIDEGLTRRNLPHKIVFLAYVDMLWPPETERLRNPDRFVFMFAPISRNYRQAMKATPSTPPLPPFDRNHLQFPSDIGGLLAFLKGWQAIFQGDSFVYDYHLISSGLYQQDPGLMRLARLIHEDVRHLKGLGLNGMVSCQLQRVFFPTGLGMYVMARALWDTSLSFDTIAQEYFTSAFGADGMHCQAYLNKLANLLDLGWLGNTPIPADAATRCRSAFGVINRFIPVIKRNLSSPDACQARSWQYLHLHALVTRRLVKILHAKATGNFGLVARNGQLLKQFVCQHEDDLQPVLDVWAFVSAYEKLTEIPLETA